MNIAICHLMGLALGPQLPPLDVKSAIMTITDMIVLACRCMHMGYASALGNSTDLVGKDCEQSLKGLTKDFILEGASNTRASERAVAPWLTSVSHPMPYSI